MRRGWIVAAGLLMAMLLAPMALAHPERHAFFPDGSVGAVPKYRSTAKQVIYVCKKDSAKRIRQSFAGTDRKSKRLRRTRLRQLRKCDIHNIQTAVNRARNRAIIRLMPGVYRELPSLRKPEPDPKCANDYDTIGGSILESGVTGKGGAKVANYEYQRKCKNAQNLIAI